MKNNTKVQRSIYLIAFIILFVIEVLIAMYVHDEFIRPYVGDLLVVALVYCFARIFIPTGIKRMTLYVFIFAVTIETLQYFRVAELLGVVDNTFFRVVLGSVFDLKDIVCYGIGCLIIRISEIVKVNFKQRENNRKL